MSGPLAVGIDIGTSSVKALAVDEDGGIVARSRIPHEIRIPAADHFEHDATTAWRDGPRAALAALDLDAPPAGVSVCAMVPSLAAVDEAGNPLTPGLLYGDARGQGEPSTGNPAETGELVSFLRWAHATAPDAAAFWPATAMANHALGGEAVLDTTTASVAYPLFDWTKWDPAVAAGVGVDVAQLPRLVPTGWAAGHVGGPDGPVLAPGCIDVLTDQIVAGADTVGDVLILMGTTLIVNTVTPRHDGVPGYWVMPHTEPERFLAGGPSNAGGLFINWALRALGAESPAGTARPHHVPVWAPYRGERVPLHDSHRRGALMDLDLTHDGAAIRRSVFEASGFVTRRMLDAVAATHGVTPRRIIATGGGTRVQEWVQALADCTGLSVQCTAVPEGAALGSAYLARMAAGLEPGAMMTDARRWAKAGRTVEPDPAWAEAAAARYERFLTVAG